MFNWMLASAENLGLKPHELVGALVLDEMSIQEDLSLIISGTNTYYSGQVVTTNLAQLLYQERKG